jgi:hypothetical protein
MVKVRRSWQRYSFYEVLSSDDGNGIMMGEVGDMLEVETCGARSADNRIVEHRHRLSNLQ